MTKKKKQDPEEKFPAGKLARTSIFARTGLKVGTNYAKYYVKRSLGGEQDVARREQLHRDNATEIYKELTRLRGTALKIAQGLSMDTGFLPEQFSEVMANAQYRVPPLNKALIRTMIKRELGKYPEQLFRRFHSEALAAASIGQVHLAETHDGRRLAVKIQYPNIRETIESDLAVAKPIFRQLVRGQNIDVYFDEIHEKLLEETDYLNEGRQMEMFHDIYDHPRVITPRLVPELTTRRILAMTHIKGVHLDDFLKTNPGQDVRNDYGQLLWDLFTGQIAARMYTIHADLHPGNFIFREDGRLGIIDFGCVKTFPKAFLDKCLLLFDAHLRKDDDDIRELYYDTEILFREQAGQARQEAAFTFFKSFGDLVLEPLQTSEFDFGDPAFRQRLNDSFKVASEMNEVRGSRHFIFINKVVFGLYFLLMKLGARISGRQSREMLENTVGDIRRDYASRIPAQGD